VLRWPVPRAASWSLPYATDPRNAGIALLYAPKKIPDAESACGMKAGMSRKSRKCSILWNTFMYMSYIAISLHVR
jgi:hypothetical protein